MSKVSDFLRRLALSPDEIAVKARLSPSRIRAILEGEEASLADLRAIARGLKVPLRSFASEAAASSELGLLFRSSTASRPDRGVEAAAGFVQAALEIMPPRNDPPEWVSSFQFAVETYPEAARLAEEFRSVFFPDKPLDPLIDLPQVISEQGGVIISRLETSRFEGASALVDGYAFVFVSPRFSGRMLFTLAHEIGHLITHHKSRRSVVFDLATQIGDGRRVHTHSEAFVNAFASVLLLPAAGVGAALQQIRELLEVRAEVVGDVELLYLARFFGVSFDVAARRCEDLELLPRGGAKSLSDYLRDNFGGAEKRAAALRLPPRPNVVIPRVSGNLLEAAAEKVKRGELSIGWVTDRLGCSISDFYASRLAVGVSSGSHH
jgi:Zn-dependent peptidase ImmA (M78 family)